MRIPPPCGHRNKWLVHLRQSVLPKPVIAIGRCEGRRPDDIRRRM